MNDRQIVLYVTLLLLVVYLMLAPLRIGSGDGERIYQVARSLAEGRGVAIPPPAPDEVVVDPFGEPIPPERLRGGGPYGAWGVDGRYYAQYGVGQSLLALPLYLLGQGIHRLTGWGTEGFVTRAAATLISPIALALTGGLLYLAARRLGYGRGAAVGTALATGLATPLWVYSKRFYSEPLVALGAVGAFLTALEGRWVACGAVLGAVATVKPVALVMAPAFLFYAGLEREGRWRRLASLSGPLAVGVGMVAAYNWLRFGSPLDTGYRTAAWDVAPWVGLFGLLLSPGKGLLWYCPPIGLGAAGLVPLSRRRRRAAILLFGIVTLYLLVHATYNHWHGGGAWGPRLILPVVPLLMLPVAEWLDRPSQQPMARLGLAALLAAGSILQVPAILVHPGRTLQALHNRAATPTEYTLRLLYRPADSPLVGQWRSLLEVSALMRNPSTRAAVVRTALAAGREERAWDGLTGAVGYLAFNSFDLWVVYWALLGAPLPPLLAVEGGLAAVAGWVLWRLRRELP